MSDGSLIFPVGTIVPMLLNKAPPGWLLCDGSEIDGNVFEELAPFLHKNDESGQYVLPDLRGYTLIGAGNYVDPDTTVTYDAQKTYGAATHTLTMEEMPSHQHFGWGEANNDGGFGQTTSKGYYGSASSDTDNYLYGTSWAGGQGSSNSISTSNGPHMEVIATIIRSVSCSRLSPSISLSSRPLRVEGFDYVQKGRSILLYSIPPAVRRLEYNSNRPYLIRLSGRAV
jgi:microcystin-dependent protein